jgi:ABC-type transport system substrate-binding protein
MNLSRTRSRRRRFLLVATLGAAVIALCGSGSSSAGSNINTDGTITIGTVFPNGTLDPTTSTTGTDEQYLYFVFDRLIGRDPKTAQLEPMLATSWKFVGPKKLELRVTLRHGVKFQDGTPLNSAAVVAYSKTYIKNGDTGNSLQYVKNITTDGPYTVIYHLSQQNAQLPQGLAALGGMIASPTAMAKEGKSFGTHPVGAGPYSFTSEVQGASYRFTRFDGYWNNAKLPRVKNVTVKVFQTDTALVNAIQSGDVNVAGGEINDPLGVLPQDVDVLKRNSNLVVAIGQSPRFEIAYFNGSKAPLDNQKIRLAFNLALNRKAIMEAATNGLGRVWTEAQPRGTLGYVKSLDPLWPYNPAKAKRLVVAAGYPNGADITCYAIAGQDYNITGPIMIAEEKAVGINLKIVPGTAAQVTPFFTNKTSQQCFFASGSGEGNPFYSYLGLWSKAYYNAGKTDFGVDPFYAKLYTTYTAKGQQQLFYDINKVEKTNPGYSILYGYPSVNVYQKNIGGWRVSPLTLDNWQGLYYKS